MVAVVDQVANKALVKVLKDITFQKNGQVVATYSDAGMRKQIHLLPLIGKFQKQNI